MNLPDFHKIKQILIDLYQLSGWKKCATTAALLLFLFNYITLPLLKNSWQNISHIYHVKSRNGVKANYDLLKPRYKEGILKLQEEVKQLRQVLQPPCSTTEMLKKIQKTALVHNIQLVSILPGGHGSNQMSSLRLLAYGNYHDFGRFMNDVERKTGMVQIGQFSLTRNDDGGRLKADMEIHFNLTAEQKNVQTQ